MERSLRTARECIAGAKWRPSLAHVVLGCLLASCSTRDDTHDLRSEKRPAEQETRKAFKQEVDALDAYTAKMAVLIDAKEAAIQQRRIVQGKLEEARDKESRDALQSDIARLDDELDGLVDKERQLSEEMKSASRSLKDGGSH